MPLSHLLLMTVYALLVSVFFAVLWRRDRARQRRLFWQLFLGMIVGAMLIGWLMYFFPSGPPTPFP